MDLLMFKWIAWLFSAKPVVRHGEQAEVSGKNETLPPSAESVPDTQPWQLEADVASPPQRNAIPELPPELANHPRYAIRGLLGEGGMGKVYLAEHKLMGRPVALKTIQCGLSSDPALVERFKREVRAAAQLNHPNVIATHDAEQVGDYLFLVMEYLPGINLHELVKRQGPLPVAIACNYTRQAALGLAHAHKCGIVHRDVKPANLMLLRKDDSETVKVLDFGLARLLQDAGKHPYGTPAGFAMGTIGFMAPEQARDARTADIHADIFSLGRTLYFLLSGQLPYRHGAQSLVKEMAGEEVVVPLTEVCPHLPEELVAIANRMTARRLEDRYASCVELGEELKRFCHA
jgi:serine/threonine-protein kinase